MVKVLNKHTKPVVCIRFVADQTKNRLLSLSEDKSVIDWDVDSGQKIYKYSLSSVPLSVDIYNNLFVTGQ